MKERYGAGDETPAGVVPCLVLPEIEETLWWLPAERALVVGDVLLGAAEGVSVCPDSWLEDEASPVAIRAALESLLDLPVERVLVSHGEPVLEGGHAALECALSC